MAITNFRRTIGTSAGVLYAHPKTSDSGEGDYNTKRIVLINVSTTPATVVLGDSAVTAATGARWVIDAGRTLSLEIEVGEAIYGIVSTGSQDIDVLVNGR